MGIERSAARQITAGRSAKFAVRPGGACDLRFHASLSRTHRGGSVSHHIHVYLLVSPGISRYPAISRHIPPRIPRKESSTPGICGVGVHGCLFTGAVRPRAPTQLRARSLAAGRRASTLRRQNATQELARCCCGGGSDGDCRLPLLSPTPRVKALTRLRGSGYTNPRYPTRPKDIHLENLERSTEKEFKQKNSLSQQTEKEFKQKNSLSQRTGSRHRCELARASTITGTPPEPPKRLR